MSNSTCCFHMANVASTRRMLPLTCCRFWQHVERFYHPFDMSHQPHVEATCRIRHVERCFDMPNVAVRHVAVFGNMSNDFFVLSTCRNKLNMFSFFRHVERTSNKLLSKKLVVWTTLSTCRTFVSSNRQSVACVLVRH